jgi:hypothetical protein
MIIKVGNYAQIRTFVFKLSKYFRNGFWNIIYCYNGVKNLNDY